MSGHGEHERTDPNVLLPSGPPTEELEVRDSEPPAVESPPRPPASPPPLPSRRVPSRPPFDKPFPASRPSSVRPAPFPRAPSAPPPPRAVPPAAPATASSRPTRDEMPPPARTPERPPERQRFLQMESALDEARSAVARQRHELDELRSALGAREARLEAMFAELTRESEQSAIEARLRALDERGDALAQELRMRVERAEQRGADVGALEARLRELEEGTELARIRMRLEVAGQKVREALERLERVEATQAALGARLDRDEERERRLARLESLLSELADEVQRERDTAALDDLRARLTDVEALTIAAGSGLRVQQEKLQALADSIVPPPRAPVASEGLTRIKGIGPKFAERLAAMGVTQVAQIAAWTDEDVKRAALQLGIKPDRIRRAGWVASARALAGG